MSVEIHRLVEELTARAERLEAAGRHDEARALYLEAAGHEATVFREIPATRPRTRGIIAVSLVSLFWRAGARDEVSRRAKEYLAQPGLPDFARSQLEDLAAGRDPAHAPTLSDAESGGSMIPG
jgi:hypothetical protein